MTEYNPPKIYEKMLEFAQTNEDPKTHFTPLNQCKCSSHLKTKLREPNWLSNLAKEIHKKQEIIRNKMEIKLNPHTRNPNMQFK